MKREIARASATRSPSKRPGLNEPNLLSPLPAIRSFCRIKHAGATRLFLNVGNTVLVAGSEPGRAGMPVGQDTSPRVPADDGLQPQFLKPVVDFLEMEVEGTEFFEFAVGEVFGDFGFAFQNFQEVGVVTA